MQEVDAVLRVQDVAEVMLCMMEMVESMFRVVDAMRRVL